VTLGSFRKTGKQIGDLVTDPTEICRRCLAWAIGAASVNRLQVLKLALFCKRGLASLAKLSGLSGPLALAEPHTGPAAVFFYEFDATIL
jgi:hypothetical protein